MARLCFPQFFGSLLLALLVSATGLAAPTVTYLGQSGQTSSIYATGRTLYTFVVIGDPQNLFASDDNNTPNANACGQSVLGGCSLGAAGCAKSPFCQGSWRDTTAREARNLAYEITGQWGKISWAGIDGGEVGIARGNPTVTGPEGPPKPDFILVVGDDQDTGENYDASVPFGSVPIEVRGEAAAYWANFFSIIDASGIPWMTARGNHDAVKVWENYFNRAFFSTKPWFFDGSDTTHEFAIRPTMSDGRQMCVVSLECAGNAAALTDVNNWIGCGASLPTIMLGHIITDCDGVHVSHSSVSTEPACNVLTTRNWYNDAINIAANNEIVGAVSGHFTSCSPINNIYQFSTPSNFAGGEDIFDIFEDQQENGRREGPNISPYGQTANDGAGLVYKVCTIDRSNSTVSCYDWSPWLRSKTSDAPAVWNMSSGSSTYSPTWATRFP